MNLAVKYRPQTFEDVYGQDVTVATIERGIKSGKFAHAVIYTGPAGTGKTTNARLSADLLNGVKNSYIEIDAATLGRNSDETIIGAVKDLIDEASQRSLIAKYKVYIIDECHMLSVQAWNAMLKLIEEPSSYTIFIFCTTDPQKIPSTIISRCQVFRFNRISNKLIEDRLKYICEQESINYEQPALEYIAKMSNGGMRQAITYLDKCKDYSDIISMASTKSIIGDCSYDTMFDLTNAVIDGDKIKIFNVIDNLYDTGTDLKLFIANYLEFTLQLSKYCILKSQDCIGIPNAFYNQLVYTTNIENNSQWFSSFVDKILKIKQAIKGDGDMRTTIEVMLTSKTA